MMSDVTGILLAGGKSRRMGIDKKSLSVGTHTLFERSLDTLRSVFPVVHVVIAQDSPPLQVSGDVLRDLLPGCGSLGGILTGLVHSSTPHIFVAACDMPFLNPLVIQFLVDRRAGMDAVVVRTETGFQTTHAVYGKGCIPIIQGMLERGELRIQELVAHPLLQVGFVDRRELEEVDPFGLSFMNVNTPSDLKMAQAWLVSRAVTNPDVER